MFSNLFPDATIHAFEPVPSLVDTLEQKFDSAENIHIHDAALGSDNSNRRFHILESTGWSTFRQFSDEVDISSMSNKEVQQEIEVSVVRLDDVLDGSIDILKLDLEGHELEALKGASNLLDGTTLVQL